jgi:hypothetical protein
MKFQGKIPSMEYFIVQVNTVVDVGRASCLILDIAVPVNTIKI